jgi:hypothetical protein
MMAAAVVHRVVRETLKHKTHQGIAEPRGLCQTANTEPRLTTQVRSGVAFYQLLEATPRLSFVSNFRQAEKSA